MNELPRVQQKPPTVTSLMLPPVTDAAFPARLNCGDLGEIPASTVRKSQGVKGLKEFSLLSRDVIDLMENIKNYLACLPSYFLHEDKCLSSCPDGYYEEDDSCVTCHSMCAKCSGPERDDCEKCASPKFFLYKGECLGRCPQGTFSATGEVHCQDCDNYCKTCHTSDICDECKEGFSKNRQGNCVPYMVCTLQEYPDDYGDCVPCHKKCSGCTGATEQHCLSCKETSFLLNSTCVKTCPDGYYAEKDERRCELCHRSCMTCTGRHSMDCLTCKEGSYVQHHSCVQHCVTG
ncbi:unnamed protein product [Ranitomeya imitator]|uniref:Growth factor receptor domain-containing protein n=1 Tax=Ranitomeya imitator TaxID=111125 RepID=A0ABN9M1X4_9NEOB|nr:unnamed protein product [Ranitomeya imitator]